MNKPIRYRGQFIVTTASNKPVGVACSIEQAEYIADQGRGRKIWQWQNACSPFSKGGYWVRKYC